MKILQPKNNGFCYGVKNAVQLAKKHAGKNVFSFGEVVHNPIVVKELDYLGVKVTKDLSMLKKGDTLIVTAHGASPSVFEECKKKGVKVVDTTCPHVKILQQKAVEYHSKGFKIVLIGSSTHPEIIGVNGWCNGEALIVDGKDKVDLNEYEKVFVMFQTTFNSQFVENALKNLVLDESKTLEIFNTICYTTIQRQNFAHEISQQADTVIVIGGKNSSNTKRLQDICKQSCKNTYMIEYACQVQELGLKTPNILGIIAGASTPSELIEEVVRQMVENTRDNNKEERIAQENAMFEEAVSNLNTKGLRKGQRVKGHITMIDENGISVNFECSKKEGTIPNNEITLQEDFEVVKSGLKVGDEIEVVVISADREITVSRKQIEVLQKDDELVEEIKLGAEFSLVASKEVKGGLLSKLGSYTVFIPSSQIRVGFVKDLAKYVGKKLRLVALPDGIDESKHKIVASQKLVLEKERLEKEENFWSNIEVGEIVEGQVVRFAPFGAFVNVRGFDCLAHVSDLSWSSIKDPSEVLELNKSYEFAVLKLDRESNRVSIGYKQLLPDPWQVAAEQFPVGTVTKGKVARILPFGAFIEIAPGIDGLLHVSNVAWDWVDDIKKVLNIGDEIEVSVVEFNSENKRVTLSRKATMEQPEQVVEEPQE